MCYLLLTNSWLIIRSALFNFLICFLWKLRLVGRETSYLCLCNQLKIQNSLPDGVTVALVVSAPWNVEKWAKQSVAILYLFFCDSKYRIELRLCRFTLTLFPYFYTLHPFLQILENLSVIPTSWLSAQSLSIHWILMLSKAWNSYLKPTYSATRQMCQDNVFSHSTTTPEKWSMKTLRCYNSYFHIT